jgi:predicted metalloprotease
MQWFGKGSNNVEDGRSGGGGKTILGGGVGIIIVVLGLIFGKDLTGLVGQVPATAGTEEVKQGVPANDPQAQFVAGVLESTEQVWDKEFQAMGKQYEYPKLGCLEMQCKPPAEMPALMSDHFIALASIKYISIYRFTMI